MPGDTSSLLRTRAFVDRWFVGIVVVFALVALAGGWLAYQGYVDPGTTTERRTVSSWETAGKITHAANVTAENPIYAVGTTLTDRPIYFRDVTPILNGTVSFVYTASDGGNLTVDVTRRTTLLSVEDNRERTVEVWRRIHRIETRSVRSVGPDSPVRVPFSVNVSRMMNVSERVDDQFDSPPGQPRLTINTTVELTGTVNDRRVDRTEVYTLLVGFDGSAYRVRENATTERYETTRAVTVPQNPGRLRTVGGPVLVLVGLLGAGGLVAARWQNRIELTEAERDRLAYEDDRGDFEEWISTIRLPEEVFDRPRARADSLAHLVDFAIDTDNGVIEDPAKNLYCVVHDGYLYTYRPPRPGSDTADGTVDTDSDGSEADIPEPVEETSADAQPTDASDGTDD